jgi:hypothetical protein
MRWAVLVFGLAGVGLTGFLGYRFMQFVNNELNIEVIRAMRPTVEAGKGTVEMALEVVGYDMRLKAYPYMFGVALLGLAGVGLALARMGMLAAVAFLVGLLIPFLFDPILVFYSAPYAVAGLLSIFIKKSPEPAGSAAS